MNILLADDNIAILELISEILSEDHHTVTTADNGLKALKLFSDNNERYELLITDIKMPELDGLTLAHKIRNIRADIPVIFISGFSNIPDLNDIREITPHYLKKPINYDELTALIRSMEKPA